MLKVGKKIIVVALGGNALVQEGEKGTIQEQFANTRKSITGIVQCIKKGFDVVITHGNGPQVGNMLLRTELSRDKVPELPLGICVADTEGAIGYMIQQTMVNSLQKEQIDKCVVTILTQVVVDKDDNAFRNPTKPIGPFFAAEEAGKIAKDQGWEMVENRHRGYRRVVASPRPLKIVERESVKRLLESGEVVIAAGGGGIPVIVEEDGSLEGADCVVDKDLASSVLALDIKADCLVMLTGVEHVCLNYGESDQKPLATITIKEAESYMAEGHFPSGSMGPKIQAAVNFLKGGGECVFITAIDKVWEAIAGKTGTRIVP
ncbi:MAG: carbamate kinase [Candidatus Scalindua sp.]|jgi:carbamate kinase|nr:carbamate kinase [Candidatus Scalindua sp.]MBT5305941.1 carbamate kinase [Candidatus Scalindua sp.]MBT6052016.1 carbamate kinase [Candidatus Scalindua sp.]MBT6226676.1 carbamate kinase [Candidatus Scalindua sp.]MBT6561251.1 carbamate kinase [Candidatus Scalindua sp.]